jgi:cytochrome c
MKTRRILIPVATIMVFSAGFALAGQAKTGDVQDVEPLAGRIGCLECHGVDRKIIGPSFRDIAGRYRAQAGARVALNEKIRNGGKGNWTEITGGVPMPPYSALLSEAEIARLVEWILGR